MRHFWGGLKKWNTAWRSKVTCGLENAHGEGARAPAIHPPSIWYAEVDAPHAKLEGKRTVSEVALAVLVPVLVAAAPALVGAAAAEAVFGGATASARLTAATTTARRTPHPADARGASARLDMVEAAGPAARMPKSADADV